MSRIFLLNAILVFYGNTEYKEDYLNVELLNSGLTIDFEDGELTISEIDVNEVDMLILKDKIQ